MSNAPTAVHPLAEAVAGAVSASHRPPDFGAKVLVIGDTGDGKTFSLQTLVDAGLEVFILFTENGMATLRNTNPDKVHWKYIPPRPASLQSLINTSRAINVMSFKQIASLQDANRSQFTMFVDTLVAMTNFKCDRTGKEFGAVDTWGRDRVFVLDSLSGASLNALSLICGDAPMRDPGEIGIAMGRIEALLYHLCFSTKCHVVVTGHVERDKDQLSDSVGIKVAVPGNKLSPKVPWFFDDVFYALRRGTTWTWATDYPGVIGLKSRHLGIFPSKPQDFRPLIIENEKLAKEYLAAPAA